MDKQNYVYGAEFPVPDNVNCAKILLDQFKKYQDYVAFFDAETKEAITYKDLLQSIVDISAALKKLGVGRGDTVALACEPRSEFMSIVIAIISTGASYTAYEATIGRSILHHKLHITKPKYVICSEIFWNSYGDIISGDESIKTLITLDKVPEKSVQLHSILEHTDIDTFEISEVKGLDDVAIILYSSGTTGLPKGVLLTHVNCINHSMPGPFSEEKYKIVYKMPGWYHNYSLFTMLKFLMGGKKIVTHKTFTSLDFTVQTIAESKANIAMLLPWIFTSMAKSELLDKYDFSSLHAMYSRSAPLHKKTIEYFMDRMPGLSVYQGYGMTECGELTSEILGRPKIGSVGKPSPNIIMKVVDLKTGKALGPNEQGEICAKGSVLTKGYVGIDMKSLLDDEGFFKTGDLGYYDEENYFFIIERIKEIIDYSGFNIVPIELEAIILLHPAVRDAGVVGKPDEVVGELPTAFVVRQPGATVTAEEIQEYVDKEVSAYMKLRGGVIFIEEIPRNQQSKIMRAELRKMLNQ